MTPKQFKHLPKCFQAKIKIDKGLAKFKKNNVLSFEHGKHLVLTQLTYRYRCEAFIKKQRNGGSATA